MRELFNSTKAVNAVPAVTSAGNAAIVGNIIDLAGFEACLFVINIGTKTDGAVAVLVEEGADSGLSDAAAVADADLLGTEADAGIADGVAGSEGIRKIGYKGAKRYVRLTLTTSSNAGSCPLAATAILSGARHAPNQGANGSSVTQTP